MTDLWDEQYVYLHVGLDLWYMYVNFAYMDSMVYEHIITPNISRLFTSPK